MADLTPKIEEAMAEWRAHGHAGDTSHDVNRALGRLPAPNRRLVILRVFEGMTWRECADEMSLGRAHKMTPEMARSMFRDSVVALKKIITRNPKLVPLVRPKSAARRP